MASKEKKGVKLDPEIASEGEDDKKRPKSAQALSSDDEEANEDLSLKLVEKHLLRRADRLGEDDGDAVVRDESKNDCALGPSSSFKLESEVVVSGPSGASGEAVGDGTSNKKRVKVRKKKKKIEKVETGVQSVFVGKEEEDVATVEKDEKAVKAEDVVESVDPNSVQISDNIVLRKLLRGPRYFDPPDSAWQTCYNCGEEGHMAINCASAKRKKPCFLCGSLDHGVRQCSKGQDCYICKKGGHRAKDCPEKYKSSSWNAKVCLKCGDMGHDMFSCWSHYSSEDLKEIQCYICKSFGHLCCVNFAHTVSRELSCFKCGQLGHSGLACSKTRGETVDAVSPSLCFKCGEEGHFARECSSSSKVHKRNAELMTPTLRPHREKKEHTGLKSAPPDLGKAHKRKKTKYEERGVTTPRKSKQRGGWVLEDPGDFSNGKATRNNWRSPGTQSGKGHNFISSPQSSTRKNFHHKYGASRFDNSGSYEIRRNYDWW